MFVVAYRQWVCESTVCACGLRQRQSALIVSAWEIASEAISTVVVIN